VGAKVYVMEIAKPWKDQTWETLPLLTEPGMVFVAHDWSSEGRRLAGYQQRADGSAAGILVFSFDSRQFEKLTDFGNFPRWLSDGRRILFRHRDKSFLVDVQTKKARELNSPGPITTFSRDNRDFYYLSSNTESDIWLLTLP